MALPESLERLAAAGIDLLPLPDLTTHYVFTRGGFVALVERTEAGFGGIGSVGVMTQRGFAALVWRGADAFFVAKGQERAAAPAEIAGLRAFAADLEGALR
jgi:hypothetical protein